MSQFIKMTLAVDFLLTAVGGVRVDKDIEKINDGKEKSITHMDYIHDEESEIHRPRFIVKLQKTFEVI